MKKSILLFAGAMFASIIIFGIAAMKPATTPMSFVTLSANVQAASIVQNSDGSLNMTVSAWYGIKDCPYTKESGGQYTGFAQWANIQIKTGINPRPSDIQQVANDSADAYRKRVYPDIK